MKKSSWIWVYMHSVVILKIPGLQDKVDEIKREDRLYNINALPIPEILLRI